MVAAICRMGIFVSHSLRRRTIPLGLAPLANGGEFAH
jgi:hypothetical protein